MSYEGHEQRLCANGHLFMNCPDSMYQEKEDVCDALINGKECGAKYVLTNSVDDTNCDSYGEIPKEEWDRYRLTEAQTESCCTCGHTKIVSDETFKIPTQGQIENMRHYRPGYGNTEAIRLITLRRK